jgi:hypothetical protein
LKTKCRLVRVIDGDTLLLDVAIPSLPGLNLWAHDLRCRLARIDCPEMKTPEGFAARERMRSIWEQGGSFEVDVVKADKYGLRWDVELWCGAANVNDLMVKGGFAKPYLGDPDMALDLLPYPTSLPDGTIQHLLELFKNPAGFDMKAEAHFLWHVGGVGLSFFAPDLSARETMSAEGCAKELESLISGGLSAGVDARGLPWNLILPIVIALIRKYLGI